MLSELLGSHEWELRQVRSLVGRLTSMTAVLPLGKAFLQSCYMAINETIQLAAALGAAGARGWRGGAPAGQGRIVADSVHVRDELSWWLMRLSAGTHPPARPLEVLARGSRLLRTSHGTGVPDSAVSDLNNIDVSCDASGRAVAAVWGCKWARELIPEHLRIRGAAAARVQQAEGGARAPRAVTGSTLVETRAILLALCTWGPEWAGRRITIYTDNQGAVAALSRLHSAHPGIAEAIRAIALHVVFLDITREIVWIPGANNRAADAVSREQDGVLAPMLPATSSGAPQRCAPRMSPWHSWQLHAALLSTLHTRAAQQPATGTQL